jgi:hypothetical protein
MPRYESGYLVKLDEVMADQEWHRATDLMSVIAPLARPETVFNTGWSSSKRSNTSKKKQDLTPDQVRRVMDSGLRTLVSHHLTRHRRSHGRVIDFGFESRGHINEREYRWTPVTRVCLRCPTEVQQQRPFDSTVLCKQCYVTSRDNRVPVAETA